MPITKEKEERIRRLLKLGREKPREEFSFNDFTKLDLSDNSDELVDEVVKKIPIPKDGADGKDGVSIKGDKGDKPIAGVDFPIPKDGKDADEEKIVENVLKLIPQPKDGKEGSPDSPEDIRNKLETLKKKDRLDIDAIRGLQEELDKIRKHAGRRIIAGSSGGVGGGHVMVKDISSDLDGVTKKFSLPAFWRVLTVDCSAFPRTLRPTTDFTTDTSDMSITFTSEIRASTVLRKGQTVIITYAEP